MSSEKTAILFGGYVYGASREDVVRESGAIPEDGAANPLNFGSAESALFLGREWSENFNFNNLGELQEVSLTRCGEDAETADAVRKSLIEKGWTPVYCEIPGDAFDALRERIRAGDAATEREIVSFGEKAIQNGEGFVICFFPSAYADKLIKKGKETTYFKALDKAPENFTMASLSYGDGVLRISFNAPILSRKNALRYGEVIKRK